MQVTLTIDYAMWILTLLGKTTERIDLVEKQFSGTISVVSVPGNTTFTISIPCEEMTV